MIKIATNGNRDLLKLSEKHYSRLKDFLIHTIGNTSYSPPARPTKPKQLACYNKQVPIANAKWTPFRDYLLDAPSSDYPYLREIILCSPDNFTKLAARLETTFEISNYVEHIKRLFDYDMFSDGIQSSTSAYSAFDLVKGLNIPVCPYCNRHYISCLENGVKKTKRGKVRRLRPPLDHFYPRSLYPVFGLSFFNLIPSCTFCNSSLKGKSHFTADSHVHPYQLDFGDAALFRYLPGASSPITLNPVDVSVQDHRVDKSKIEFELETLYNDNHTDIAQELYNKRLEDSYEHFKSIEDILEKIAGRKPRVEEFYQFYFGNYMRSDDFEKRPLAKFTHDLVTQYEILKYAGY
jgi:hypothetical protein